MDIRIMQSISMFFWRRYSVTIDRMNQNAINRKFALDNQNVPVFEDRSKQWSYLYHEVLQDVPVDYLEFGVYKGDSIHQWSVISFSPDSRFYGFDTFTGLPEHWFVGFEKNAFDAGGKVPILQDKRITFFRGLFQDTLPGFLRTFDRKHTLVVHIDADLYSSTLFVLASLHPYLRNGDIIMFDDFLDPVGEFRAFSDYRKAFRVQAKIVSAVKYGKLFDKAIFIIDNLKREDNEGFQKT